MTKIKDIISALNVFEEAANLHGLATEQGDYKTANRNYGKILKAITYLKEQNKIDELLRFSNHSSIGVRIWAGTYLLPKHEGDGLKILEEILNIKGIHALTAKTTIDEWGKGNLKL